MTTQDSFNGTTKTDVLEERLNDFGWGLLLIVVGGILLLPSKHVPQGSWLIAAGLILLGLNVARALSGLGIRGFSVILGVVALIAGLGEFFEIGLPLFPIVLIVIGAYALLKRPFKDSRAKSHEGWGCCGC